MGIDAESKIEISFDYYKDNYENWSHRKMVDNYNKPESVKFHFYKNQPINVAIFYRLHTDYNQSYRSKGHTPPLEFQ